MVSTPHYAGALARYKHSPLPSGGVGAGVRGAEQVAFKRMSLEIRKPPPSGKMLFVQPAPPRPNRTLWIVLGVVAITLSCCCGGPLMLGLFGYQRGRASDAEAKTFARSAVLAIGKDWSADEFRKYASPALVPMIGQSKATQYRAGWSKKLGHLKSLGEFTTTGIYFGSQNGLPPATRVKFTASATFVKGEGTVFLGVAKADGKWGIENLDISSDALQR